MAIDPNIILAGQQQPNTLNQAASGIQFGQGIRQLLALRQIGNMNNIADDAERKNFANNSMFSRELNAQLKSDNALKQKQVYDQLKTEADIAKTSSEASKNIAQAGGFSLDNSLKGFGAIQGVFQSAAMTGDKGQVLLGLDALKRTGAITPEDYAHQFQIVKAMKTDEFGRSDELKQYASGIGLGNKDVAPYLYQSKNNEADNAQSDKNSQRTYDASIHSTDVGADTADKNRAQQGEQFSQTLDFNKAKELVSQQEGKVQLFGDKAYFIDKFGKATPVSGIDGKQLIGAKSETPIQKIERQEKALGYADSAKSAADASVLAANLANDLKGLNSTAGGFGIFAKIPGSPQRAFASKIETLKSQVFLNQIAKMRGLGALTDAEGARLEKSIASLDINLEPSVLQANLTEIAKVMSQVAVRMNKTTQIYTGGNGSNNQTSQVNSYSFMP